MDFSLTDVLLLEITCKHCQTHFYMCRKCYRGHVYCSDKCRYKAYSHSHRKFQSKYRTSKKGRETHRLYEQNRRRNRESEKNKKNMADRTTTPHKFRVIIFPLLSNMQPRCSYCGAFGRVVKKFPPRWAKSSSPIKNNNHFLNLYWRGVYMGKRFSCKELFSVRNDIKIDTLIEKHLGMYSKIINGYFRFVCPICSGLETATNPATNLARCFRCERNFNTIDMVMITLKVDFIESVNFLKKLNRNN